jgi:hypothetical protein
MAGLLGSEDDVWLGLLLVDVECFDNWRTISLILIMDQVDIWGYGLFDTINMRCYVFLPLRNDTLVPLWHNAFVPLRDHTTIPFSLSSENNWSCVFDGLGIIRLDLGGEWSHGWLDESVGLFKGWDYEGFEDKTAVC